MSMPNVFAKEMIKEFYRPSYYRKMLIISKIKSQPFFGKEVSNPRDKVSISYREMLE